LASAPDQATLQAIMEMRGIIGAYLDRPPYPPSVSLPRAVAERLLGMAELVEDVEPDEVAARLCLRQKLDGAGPSAYG
jgi:hypothetical protein